MRIDAHQHFWTLSRGDYDWLTPDLAPLYRDFEPSDVLPVLATHGIAGTIAVQAAETIEETRHLLALANQHEWILGVVGWCDFGARDAADQIGSLAAHPKLVGLRPMLQDMDDRHWILRLEQAPALEAMQRSRLVFDALIRSHQTAHIATLADRYPALSIVIDHAAKPPIGDQAEFAEWRDAICAVARRINVSCKLSGLVTEARPGAGVEELRPYVDVLLESFGAERLIWGSDWPVLNLGSDYAAWLSLSEALLGDLNPPEIAAITGGNALRTYHLAGSREGQHEQDRQQ